MATEQRHITRIEKTEALFRSNGDHGQSAILTDQNEEWVYYNDDKSLLYYAAAQKTWNGAAWAYVNNDFGQVTLHDDLLVDEYIKRVGGTDDYIRFENDKITIDAGGADAMVFEDDKVYTDLHFGIGKVPSYLLDMQQDQNGATECRITNITAGNASHAGFLAISSGGNTAQVLAHEATHATTRFQDKAVFYSGGNSGMVIEQGGAFGIEFWTNALEMQRITTEGKNHFVNANVSHPFTAILAADIYAEFKITNSSNGGLDIRGFSDTDQRGLGLFGAIGASNPADTTEAIYISGSKSDGSDSVAVLGADETVLTINNLATLILRLLGDGAAQFSLPIEGFELSDCETGHTCGGTIAAILHVKHNDFGTIGYIPIYPTRDPG